MNINLIDYLADNSQVLIGIPHGKDVATSTNITSILNTEKVTINVPYNLWMVSVSFWIGLLGGVAYSHKYDLITMVGRDDLVAAAQEAIDTLLEYDTFQQCEDDINRKIASCPFINEPISEEYEKK